MQGFEKFADLVRITVVKLRAEGREGELGEGTLHSLLVKKLTESQVERYSRWLQEEGRDRSVLCLKDWLKEEVRIRVEAMEMPHGLSGKETTDSSQSQNRYHIRSKPRGFHIGTDNSTQKKRQPEWQNQVTRKPPCACCGSPHHGIWSCEDFQRKRCDARWQLAKDKQLCFRCLAGDLQGKACIKSQMCLIDGCRAKHHRFLHEGWSTVSQPIAASQLYTEGNTHPSLIAREGVGNYAAPEGENNPATRTIRMCDTRRLDEAFSLRTIPVWVKASGRKIKVNAILDDASNESFLNEEAAGALGLTEPYQTVKVHVLNNSVETFQTMPLKVETESINGQFTKEIEVETCPRTITGNYKAEDWRVNQPKWPHLATDVYEFSRVVFGKNSAPMEAQFIAQENARRHRSEYPLGAKTVLQSTYMDDSLDSVEVDKIGLELYHQLNALWAKTGMHARKWVSNSEIVVAAIPEEDRATEVNIKDSKNTVTSTLGLQWNSTEDVFIVSTVPVSPDYLVTKRNVLKMVATVFDPLGLVSPFIVEAKLLLQELWSRGYDWDEEVQDEVANPIHNWFSQLQLLKDVKVPRCLQNQRPLKSKEVVTFVDASQQGYGAASYLRCKYEDGWVTSRLIASKTKVARLTPMTVPRLGLMGAIVGSP